jgi:hypothetical protein
MGGAEFCHVLGTLRAAGPVLDSRRFPTLAALSELAAHFQPTDPTLAQQQQHQAQQKGASATPGASAKQQPGNGRSAGAAAAMQLGGGPLMPSMLMDVVTRFLPHSGHNSSSLLALEVRQVAWHAVLCWAVLCLLAWDVQVPGVQLCFREMLGRRTSFWRAFWKWK